MLESRFLLFTLFLTFGLIVLGGFVHNTESSLACPDWPWCTALCYGKTLPEEEHSVGIERRHQIEMSHRIWASLVGMCTVGFFLMTLIRKRFQPKITLFGFILVLLVLFQGGLGALTVKLQLPTLVSTAHLAIAQLFFAFLIGTFFLISFRASSQPHSPTPSRLLSILLGSTLVLFYVQILLGAYMRHSGSGLAAGAGPNAAILGVDLNSGTSSFWPSSTPARLNMLHRYLALVLTGIVCWLGILLWKFGTLFSPARFYSIALIFSVLAQVLIGVLSIWYFLHITLITLHLAFGTLCFGISVGAWMHLRFLCTPWNYHKNVPL